MSWLMFNKFRKRSLSYIPNNPARNSVLFQLWRSVISVWSPQMQNTQISILSILSMCNKQFSISSQYYMVQRTHLNENQLRLGNLLQGVDSSDFCCTELWFNSHWYTERPIEKVNRLLWLGLLEPYKPFQGSRRLF